MKPGVVDAVLGERRRPGVAQKALQPLTRSWLTPAGSQFGGGRFEHLSVIQRVIEIIAHGDDACPGFFSRRQRRTVPDKRATAPAQADLDDTALFQSADRLAQGRSADSQFLGQVSFDGELTRTESHQV